MELVQKRNLRRRHQSTWHEDRVAQQWHKRCLAKDDLRQELLGDVDLCRSKSAQRNISFNRPEYQNKEPANEEFKQHLHFCKVRVLKVMITSYV